MPTPSHTPRPGAPLSVGQRQRLYNAASHLDDAVRAWTVAQCLRADLETQEMRRDQYHAAWDVMLGLLGDLTDWGRDEHGMSYHGLTVEL